MEYINLRISAATLVTIGAGLRELPFKVADPALKEIDSQVKAHLEKKESANVRAQSSQVGDADGDGNGPDRNYVEQDRQAG
jgi:hypothetical protein